MSASPRTSCGDGGRAHADTFWGQATADPAGAPKRHRGWISSATGHIAGACRRWSAKAMHGGARQRRRAFLRAVANESEKKRSNTGFSPAIRCRGGSLESSPHAGGSRKDVVGRLAAGMGPAKEQHTDFSPSSRPCRIGDVMLLPEDHMKKQNVGEDESRPSPQLLQRFEEKKIMLWVVASVCR